MGTITMLVIPPPLRGTSPRKRGEAALILTSHEHRLPHYAEGRGRATCSAVAFKAARSSSLGRTSRARL